MRRGLLGPLIAAAMLAVPPVGVPLEDRDFKPSPRPRRNHAPRGGANTREKARRARQIEKGMLKSASRGRA